MNMMTNLFSIFDPSSSINIQLNWLSLFIPLILFPQKFWILNSNYQIFWKLMIMKIFQEFKILLTYSISSSIIFITLMIYIMLINFMGLFPYIFTPSSHLSFTLSLSLTLWMSMMIYNWYNYIELSLAHLVPSGTPNLLMSFMVMIETISNIIRPSTLAIRLSANMIAGHLLLTLIGTTESSSEFLILLILIIIQSMLMILEMSVAIIQSYVFSILSILYSTEIN